MFTLLSPKKNEIAWRGILALVFVVALLSLLTARISGYSDLLIAEELDHLRLNPPQGYMSVISDEALRNKALLDAGWPCGDPGRPCAHILVNTSDSLLCVPAQTKEGCLMVPLEHFRLLAGCGLETGVDDRIRLIKYDKAYHLDMERNAVSHGNESIAIPVPLETIHGDVYVPLRFLCEMLDLEIQWREAGGVVLLHSPWVENEALTGPMASINERILAELAANEIPQPAQNARQLSDPFDLTVTFYYTGRDTTYTASGAQAIAGSVAADSGYPFGTQFYIPELGFISESGVFTVHDRGGAVKGNKIDVFLPNTIRQDPEVSAALRRGRYTVTGYLILPT
ncbi:MAG: 3D domain-containing protein [Clostridiales bacterium]|nr:3D domain-containing protein [Clostridiales bacterium]